MVATQFAKFGPKREWAFFYLTHLGFALINNVLVILVFKWKRQECTYYKVSAG